MKVLNDYFNIESKILKLTIFLELLSYLYVFTPVIVELVAPDYWITDLAFVFESIMYNLLVPVIILIFIWKEGWNNSRVVLTLHFGAIISMMSGILGIAEAMVKSNKGDLISDMFFSVIPAVVFSLSVIHNSWALGNHFHNQLEEIKTAVTDGNLDIKIDKKTLSDGIFGIFFQYIVEILSDVGNMVTGTGKNVKLLVENSGDLLSGTEEISASAEEVASTSQAMSDGATTQTELITEVNDDVGKVQLIVDDIVKKIQLNTNEVAQIALQTNILALNAGIEASRAGDYGRGFAVVAENVRKLSDQSKMASERIETVADEIRDTLQASFNKISNTMINVVSVSEETAASAEEVAAAAEEMNATIEQLSSVAESLSNQADSYEKLIEKYNKK